MVTLAEERLKRGRKAVFATAQLPQQVASLADVAPILRGACSLKDEKDRGRVEALHPGIPRRRRRARISSTARSFARYSQAGVVTPDHTIRTKNWPLIVPAPDGGKLADFQAQVARRGRELRRPIPHLFRSATTRASAASRSALDPMPRVVLVPGLGLFGLGRSKKDARVAADLAEAAIETITDAEATGRFEAISRSRHVRHGILVARTGKARHGSRKPLAGQIVAVTGAGGAIGAATAQAFAAAGAEVALLDVNLEARDRKSEGDRRRGGRCATSPTPLRCARPSTGSPRPSAGSISWCRTRAHAAAGPIGEVDEAVICARASS